MTENETKNTALATTVDLGSRLPVKVESIRDLQTLGSILYQSGFFKDVDSAKQSVVKVLAGAEIGLGPVASMTSINIIEGKPSFSSNLIASKIKSHPNYDYVVDKLTTKGCTVSIMELQPVYDKDDVSKISRSVMQKVGEFSFEEDDAKAAGLLGKKNWKTYPKAMYFSRAISQAARVYCPDVFHSVIPYTVEELAPDVELSEHGEIVDSTAIAVESIPDDKKMEAVNVNGDTGEVILAEKAEEGEPKTKTEEAVVEAEDTTEAKTKEETPPAGPPEGKPWMDPALSIQENRNILYGVAISEWGYKDADDVRETIIEANIWTSKPPIPDLRTLDAIALHLLEQSPDDKA